jgi:hypothetical protein
MDRTLIFVDSKHYRGDCRRTQDRFEVKGSVKMNFNEQDMVAKLSNLSRGGCRLVANHHCRPQASIYLTFLIPSKINQRQLQVRSPILARVVRSHHTPHDHYIINIQFRGALLRIHGVDELIEQNLDKKLLDYHV